MPSTATQPTIGKRIDALDALRAAAMTLGVLLHASVAYQQMPFQGLVWPVREPSEHLGFDVVFWFLHGFRIPLFFLLAGFFSTLLCDARGPSAYLKHRLRRVGVPLVGAAVLILPVMYFLWSLGLVGRNVATWDEVRRAHFQEPGVRSGILGVAHLWFLQYLLLYNVGTFAFRRWCPSLWSRVRKIRFLGSWWMLAPPLFVTFLFLWVRPDIFVRFENRWAPEPARFAYYAVFYFVGACLHQDRERLARLERPSAGFLVAAVAAFAVLLPMLREHLAAPTHDAWPLALVTAVFAWTAIWGTLGLFLKLCRTIPARVRVVSDGAYWIYLVHLPLVALLQLLLVFAGHRMGLRIPPLLSFVITVSGAFAIALATYVRWVRYGTTGRWLHGPRVREPGRSGGVAAPDPVLSSRAAREPARPTRQSRQ